MITLATTDFDAALAALGKLGLRVDMIMPADAPHVAELSGHGVQLRLEAPPPAVARDGTWHAGRAGMQYRDLIPDRLGGRLIASHIRVPDGGPVPDYVHYHAIRFQMIYCYRGWVRLVYEDQGEPFVMEAGDCVLQPPQIRHRVLACSPGLEVIELASPAVHATFADHELALPNGTRAENSDRAVRVREDRADLAAKVPLVGTRDRAWDGQRFAWLRRGFAADAMTAATGGLADLRVRTDTGAVTAREIGFGFVLRGTLTVDGRDLGTGDGFAITTSVTLADGSPDLEWFEVSIR